MDNEEFLDEKIIEMINQVEQPIVTAETTSSEKKHDDQTIYSGIKLNGKWIEFEKRSLAEHKITIMVPKEFVDMEPEKAKIKYPSEQRPKTILTDYTGTINILFHLMEGNSESDEAVKARNHLFRVMQRVNPGVKLLTMGVEAVSGKDIAYVEFSNPAMDGKLYNLMFYLSVEGGILMGSFNCNSKVMKYWKKPAFEMMCSIDIVREVQDGGESEINECKSI